MASQGGTSRLAQMQMRFQQKQQQEREQRKIEMTGGNKLNVEGIEIKSLTSTIGPGKVRQMFDERRQRSTGSATTTVTTTSSSSSSSSSSSTTTMRKQTSAVKQTIKKAENEFYTSKKSSILNGDTTILSNEINSDHMDNANDYENNNETLNVTIPNKLPNVGKLSSGHLENNRKLNGNASGDKNNNSSRTASNASIKLKPVVTKKTLPIEQKSPKKSQSSNLNSTTSRQSTTTRSPEKSLFTLPKQKTNAKTAVSTMSKSSQDSFKEPDTAAPIPDNMAACQFCGRHFNVDRIEKHQEICEKMANKKRKIFDASKHRVKGTEAEQYVKKAIKNGKPTTNKLSQESAASIKNSWRKKHEEFIQAIRSAKEMQAHLARGGKLSDLPPPPPSENPDYIQCPHCKRRFNEAAATRHIPKCADMIHNKPKPGAPAKKGAKR